MTVNGENLSLNAISGEASLSALISHMKLAPNRIAVELNGELVDPAAFATTLLSDNDVLELIHYVGGG